ncbi:MAG: deoxyribose-phosphate aldolase [Erysipelotrichaceae bacterium]|nr:deoxyribose-phosphate aldolase [Erysipelotrichaceae bacterium]
MKLSKYIDHTLLKADATKEQITKLCKEAIEHDFKSVCVNPSYIPLCKELLKGSDVLVCTVIGFPLGQMSTKAKVFETSDAIAMGADEVDMVINIAKLKEKDHSYNVNEISEIKKACGDKTLKVIIETCLLNNEEKIDACHSIVEAGADFVKTSTGFSTSGATFEDVELLKKTVGDKALVKAAGGVKSHDDFLKMVELGADRIGTSSGVKLIQE